MHPTGQRTPVGGPGTLRMTARGCGGAGVGRLGLTGWKGELGEVGWWLIHWWDGVCMVL
jgi:hypothetical protein